MSLSRTPSSAARFAPIVAVAITVTLWASAFPAIRVGLRDYDPFALAALRFGIAGFAILLLAASARIPWPSPRDGIRILLAGGLGIAAYNLMLNAGEMTLAAGPASFIMGTGPIFTALLAARYLDEHLSKWGWTAIGVSFAGVALIALAEGDGVDARGAVLVLAAAFCQASQFVIQRPLSQRYGALALTTYIVIAGALFLLPFAPHALQRVIEAGALSEPSTLAVLYLGLAPGVAAYVCWTYALSVLPAPRLAIYLYLVPPISTLIAFFALGESVHPVVLAGGAIALSGVVMLTSSRRPPARLIST